MSINDEPHSSLSLISKIVKFDFDNLSRAVSIYQELEKKKKSGFLELWFGVAIHFCVYKGISKKYKGTFAFGPFLLSFEAGWSN